MKLSKILSIVIMIYVPSMCVTMAFCGENWLINSVSILLITIESLLLLIILNISPNRCSPLILLLSIIIMLFYLLRFWSLILEPNLAIQYFSIEAGDLNWALVYLILGTAQAGMGFWLGSPKGYRDRRTNKGEAKKQVALSYSPIVICIIMLVVECVTLFEFYTIVAGRLGSYREASLFHGIVATILDMHILFLIFIVIIGGQWKYLAKRLKLLAGIVLMGYSSVILLMGSKAAIYYPLVFWLLYKVAKDGNPKINTKRLVAFSVPLFIVAIVSFNAARIIRPVVYFGGETSYSQRLADIALLNWEFEFKNDILNVCRRLEGIDHLVVIVSDKRVNVSDYINLENEVKSFLNLILPGQPFRVPLTAQAFGVAYVDVPMYEYLEGGLYTTYVMMMWGLFYAHFGFAVGLIAILMATFALARLYEKICKANTRYKIFLKMWCMYIAYWALMAMGFDLWMFVAIQSFFVGMLYLLILKFLSSRPKLG